MARKLHPLEERALVQSAPPFEKAFRKNGCRARREQAPPALPLQSERLDSAGELPNWAQCSWPDEWGW